MISIKDINRRFFESTLAQFVLNYPDCVPAVALVSQNIIRLMTTPANAEEIIKQIEQNPKIKAALYGESFFGRLHESKDSPVEIYQQLLSSLADPAHKAEEVAPEDSINLSQVMHLHALFIYRIYPHLPYKQLDLVIDEESELSTKLTPSQRLCHLFNQAKPEAFDFIYDYISEKTAHSNSVLQDRGREKKAILASSSSHLGYEMPRFFKQKMSSSDEHVPGGKVWQKASSSHYCRLVSDSGIPYVAGVSAHTLSFIRGLFFYGNLDIEQTQQYALAIFAYLGGGGNHSFNEVMMVMHLVAGMDYIPGEYTSCLPQSLLTHELFEKKLNTVELGHHFEKTIPKYLRKRWSSFFETIIEKQAQEDLSSFCGSNCGITLG